MDLSPPVRSNEDDSKSSSSSSSPPIDPITPPPASVAALAHFLKNKKKKQPKGKESLLFLTSAAAAAAPAAATPSAVVGADDVTKWNSHMENTLKTMLQKCYVICGMHAEAAKSMRTRNDMFIVSIIVCSILVTTLTIQSAAATTSSAPTTTTTASNVVLVNGSFVLIQPDNNTTNKNYLSMLNVLNFLAGCLSILNTILVNVYKVKKFPNRLENHRNVADAALQLAVELQNKLDLKQKYRGNAKRTLEETTQKYTHLTAMANKTPVSSKIAKKHIDEAKSRNVAIPEEFGFLDAAANVYVNRHDAAPSSSNETTPTKQTASASSSSSVVIEVG